MGAEYTHTTGDPRLTRLTNGPGAAAVTRVTTGPGQPAILFTAFEPSGDDHASAVIRELRRRHPDLVMHAWGGPKMAEAGATLVHDTVHDAAMGLPGLRKIAQHLAYNRAIGAWLEQHSVVLHVPVDSPAANFPICKITRARNIPVAHLVAPQFWAWAPWRIRKLRRLSNHVMCLLPFEEEWFSSRGVPATFIGHPVFDSPLDDGALADRAAGFPKGKPRMALMPGSRSGEIAKNFPVLLAAFRELKRRRPTLVGVVAATTERVADTLRAMAERDGGWPDGLGMIIRGVDAAARWCDVALAVSGTVTLHIARQRRPMIVLYKVNPVLWTLVGRWLVPTEHFALPNVVAARRIVPELVPYFGGPARLVRAAEQLIDDAPAREEQRRRLAELATRFDGRNAAVAGADVVERMAGVDRPGPEVAVVTRPAVGGAPARPRP